MTAKPRSSPTALLVITAALAIGIGLVIAALLLVATGGGDAPKGPFALGSAAGLRDEVKKSPVYIADPTGGEGIWLALRGNDFVALSAVPPGGSRSCTIRWRDSVRAYQDCHGNRYHTDDLATYPLELRNGSVYVDTRHVVEPTGISG